MLLVKLAGVKTYCCCQSSCFKMYIDHSKKLGKIYPLAFNLSSFHCNFIEYKCDYLHSGLFVFPYCWLQLKITWNIGLAW